VSESDTKESEDVPLEPEEESQGVIVVVTLVTAALACMTGVPRFNVGRLNGPDAAAACNNVAMAIVRIVIMVRVWM